MEKIHCGGAEKFTATPEFRAMLRKLRKAVYARFAEELEGAGIFRRCILWWRREREFRRERSRIFPSPQSLFGSQGTSARETFSKNS